VKTIIFLFLVQYPACGDAIYEQLEGPFADVAACEERLAYTTKHRGPPSPGQTYQCRGKP
jgi:hypothetical protein